VLYKSVIIIMPPTVPKGAISVNFVRPSVRLSVTYIANNSRTQRPSVPKFGMKVPHLRTVKGWGYRRGILCRPNPTATLLVIVRNIVTSVTNDICWCCSEVVIDIYT